MIIRLKHDEKPTDSGMVRKYRINQWDKNSEVVWMTEDEFYKEPIVVSENNPNVPESIRLLIPKWHKLAEERFAKTTDKEFYPIKGAQSIAYFYDAKYEINVGVVQGIGNIYTQDYIYELIEKDVAEDLYRMGALYVMYEGMMD